MKLALCQINPIVGDLKGNTKKILEYYNRALNEGAELAIFPELCITGYPPMDLVERIDFIEDQILCLTEKIAPVVKDCAVILGAVTKNDGNGRPYFNSAVFIQNTQITNVICKQLLPNYDLFDEKRHYQAGSLSAPIEFNGHKLGITICEDMWRNENNYYQKLYATDPVTNLLQQGADIMINIAASPFSRNKDLKRLYLMRSYAKNNQVPFIFVNTVGANDSVIFDGSSRVVNIIGETIVKAQSFDEDLVICDLVSDASNVIVENSNSVRDVHSALVLGIKDYVYKTGLSGVVIGSSGGIDSALVTVLCAEALGSENVTCITMPTRFSSEGSVNDSKKLCSNLGVELIEVPIEDLFNGYNELFNQYIEYKMSSLAMENIQPRIRANILMAVSNSSKGKILMATGNKSEISTGYCTIYGDTCGALAPLGDVYKTEVYDLANYINNSGEVIPRAIIDKAPSAELRDGQKDSDSLPDYYVLDRILKFYIDGKKSINEIVELMDVNNALVEKVAKLVYFSEFKRRQLPPVLKVSDRSFVLDRRFPVVHKLI